MRYSAAVEDHFIRPRNIGPLTASDAVFRGEAGTVRQGTRVVIEARIRNGLVEQVGFRAMGCPYVIAGCSRATEILTGSPVQDLQKLTAAALAIELDAPPERLGRLLAVEDALRNCFQDWDTRQPTAAR